MKLLGIQTGEHLGENSASVIHCAIWTQIAKSRNQIEDTQFFSFPADKKTLTTIENRLSQTGVPPTGKGRRLWESEGLLAHYHANIVFLKSFRRRVVDTLIFRMLRSQ